MPTYNEDGAGNYSVGNKRPPKHRQFQLGKSGNPTGRPKGSIGIKAKLANGLRKIVTVKKKGKPTKMMREDVIVEQLLDNSMRGDLKSVTFALRMNDDFTAQAQTAAAVKDFPMPDTEALKRISARLKRRLEEDS
jgi:hypothetical protein